MTQHHPAPHDPVEGLIAQHWPAEVSSTSLEARLLLIPQQFSQESHRPRTRELSLALPRWIWILGGGAAGTASLAGFALGALGLVVPGLTPEWASLAYGSL